MPIAPDDKQGKLARGAGPGVAPATADPAPRASSPGAIKTAAESAAPTVAAEQHPALERPLPALQAHGVQMGIGELNSRVQSVHESYTKAYGVPPSPGLTFDLATSKVDSRDFNRMFTVPLSQFGARNRGVINSQMQADPHDWLVKRPDGIVQPNTPFFHMLDATAPVMGAKPDLATLPRPQLLKKYPMVTMGVLPIPSANALYGSVSYLNARGPTAVQDGTDIAAAAKNAPDFEHYKLRGGSLLLDAGAVTTVKEAQQQLNKAMNTDLPATGTMNASWMQAIHNWMGTRDYVVKTLKYQAKSSGFGDNVEAYARAWHQKQRVASHGLVGHFVDAMPLPLFGHGGWWDDIVSIPGYVKGDSNNPIDVGLHSLTKTAGLTLDVVAGTVSQAKADAAAGTTLAREITLADQTNGKTYRKALYDAREQLRANPTWLRIAAVGYLPEHESAGLEAVDQLTNFAGDLILLRKPIFTGERLAAGDAAGAARSPYIRATSKFAYADLAEGNVARAASMFEGGPGAEKLATAAEPFVKDGSMSVGQFRQHAIELFAHGHTTLADGTTVEGPLLGSLRSAKLPTPGKPGVAWIATKRNISDLADNFDQRLRDANVTLDSHAVDFVRYLGTTVRSAVGHAAPRSARGYFDPGLPEGVRNYVVKYLKDPKLAEQFANDAVRLRAKSDVTGLQALDEKLRELYDERFPVRGESTPKSPFDANLETEAPSVFHFPGGGQREITGDAIDRMVVRWQNRAAAVNQGFNKVGRYHALAILSTGFSLAFKHVSDTARRALAEDGLILGDTLSAGERADLDAALKNAKVNRAVGAFLERSRDSETRWMLRRSGRNVNSVNFTTADQFASTPHMTAAGGYLRRRLDSEALDAYLQSHDDPDALAKLILHNDFFRARFYGEMSGEVAAAKATRDAPQLTLGDAAGTDRGKQYGSRLYELARDYAPKIANEFKDFEDAARAAGVADPWTEAAAVYAGARGAKADAALGAWIKEHEINFDVRGGLVSNVGHFDDAMTKWVGLLMTANKWNRGELAKREFERKFADLRGAGFDHETSAAVAMDVSERLVKYHMLDFSNRLQIEQDLRWVSYFATKHRLYWKWVLATMVRRPGVAVVVNDVKKNLNGNGSVDFTLFGQKLSLPAARLVWVPGKLYSEFSPLSLAAYGFVKGTAETGNVGTGIQQALDSVGGTYGNIFTRQDTTLNLTARLVAVYTGAVPATYGLLTAGLPKAAKDQVNFLANSYQARYMKLHGHPASESEVVKYALLHATARTFWQSGMPLPVVPASPENPAQGEIKQFMALNDPRKRRAYLENHPDVASYFGIWTNPAHYSYARTYWSRLNTLNGNLEAERASILSRAQADSWTPELETEYRAASKKFGDAYDQLLLEDARATGKVRENRIVEPGTWGKAVKTDPFLNARLDVHNLFPKISRQELVTHVPGAIVNDLRAELKLVNEIIDKKGDPQYAPLATDLDALKTRRRDLISQLEAYKGFPSSAPVQAHTDYQTKHVNAYWSWEEKAYAKIQALPSSQQDTAWADFQAARDERDKSVVVDGVKFPSPVRMAWAMLDPQTRQQRLARLASGDWSHLTDYEKELLGTKLPDGKTPLSQAWAWYQKSLDQWHKESPGQSFDSSQLAFLARHIDKYRPGFYKDYLFAQKSKAERFKYTTLYQDAPAAVKPAVQEIIAGALAYRKAADANGDQAYYASYWRKYVDERLTGWLAAPGQERLREWLAPFGPDFLYTLPNR